MTRWQALSGLAVAAAFALAATEQALAQDRSALCDRTSPGASQVQGRVLLPDLTFDGRQRAVYATPVLDGTPCFSSTDSAGFFVLDGLAPGTYELRVGSRGYRSPPPLEVVLPRDSAQHFVFMLRPGNTVDDCLSRQACAAILTRRPSHEVNGSSAAAFRVFAYRLALALVGGEWGADEPWALCADGGETVRAALSEIHPTVVPLEDCGGDPTDGRSELRTPSGQLARSIRVQSDIPEAGAGTVDLVTYSDTARGWRCSVTRVGDYWLPTDCWVVWVA